jgi:hypothetical protein
LLRAGILQRAVSQPQTDGKIFPRCVCQETCGQIKNAETPVAACIPVAVFIDGDGGLTDIQARKKNPVPAETSVANLHFATAR